MVRANAAANAPNWTPIATAGAVVPAVCPFAIPIPPHVDDEHPPPDRQLAVQPGGMRVQRAGGAGLVLRVVSSVGVRRRAQSVWPRAG